jgi:hypothetical protein
MSIASIVHLDYTADWTYDYNGQSGTQALSNLAIETVILLRPADLQSSDMIVTASQARFNFYV